MFGAPIAKTSCMWGVDGTYACGGADYATLAPGVDVLMATGAAFTGKAAAVKPAAAPAPPSTIETWKDPKKFDRVPEGFRGTRGGTFAPFGNPGARK